MEIGIDMTTISRFSNYVRIAEKILSENEYMYFQESTNKQQFVASRFCLKEAFVKCLKIGVLDIDLKTIEVVKEENGAIHILFNDKIYKCSLTHENDTCVGVVVYE